MIIGMRGFTLIEMAVVLALLGILTSHIVEPLSAKLERNKRAQTLHTMEQIRIATLGYLIVEKRLPCPATVNSQGWALAECAGMAATGYVPVATLGLTGPVDSDGLLLDGWGNRFRFIVSGANHPLRGDTDLPDFTSHGELLNVGLGHVNSDLVICRVSTSSGCSLDNTVVNQLPLIIVSAGKDDSDTGLQGENSDDDAVYVAAGHINETSAGFDDLVSWISENELFFYLSKGNDFY